MQTGRTDPQEIRNNQSTIFLEIRSLRFRFRSKIGSNYGRSFCIQCSVDSKDVAAILYLKLGRSAKLNRKFPEFSNFQKKGQPREVNRNFRNEFPEIPVPFDFEPESPEILVEWNATSNYFYHSMHFFFLSIGREPTT